VSTKPRGIDLVARERFQRIHPGSCTGLGHPEKLVERRDAAAITIVGLVRLANEKVADHGTDGGTFACRSDPSLAVRFVVDLQGNVLHDCAAQ